MPPSAEIDFEVPFHDVDMMGVVWHGHYYKYFELARTALFRKFQCDGPQLYETGYMLPVIDSHCRYTAPLRYGMHVRAAATLAEIKYRIKINYLLRDKMSGHRLAKGSTIQVVVKHESFELCYMTTPQAITVLFQEGLCGS